MKKFIMVFGLIGLLFLNGCSLIGEVNNTIEYANITTEYINFTKTFATEVSTLAKEAVADEAARQNLEDELEKMKEQIHSFNQVEPPTVAEDIHNQIVSSNAKLEEGIDVYLDNIENGSIDPAALENSEILTTVNEISNLMETINQVLN